MNRRTLISAAAVVALTAAGCGSTSSGVAVSTTASATPGAATATSGGTAPSSGPAGTASSATTTGGTGAAAPAGSAALLAKVGATTSSAKSASMATLLQVVSAGVPKTPDGTITMTGSGAFDYAKNLGSLHADFTGMKTSTGELTSIDLITADGTTYVKLPPEYVTKAGGKHWTTATGGSSGSGLNLDPSSLDQFTDPSQLLKLLEGVSDSGITIVGHETLHGADTTHYHVELDLAKAASSSAESSATTSTAAGAAAGTSGTTADTTAGDATSGDGGFGGAFGVLLGGGKPVPADVWVDADGRMRKFSIALDLGALLKAFADAFPSDSGPTSTAPAAFTLKMSVQLELWDFGKPVTVTIPDPADVAPGISLPGMDNSTDGGTSIDSMPADSVPAVSGPASSGPAGASTTSAG